LTGLVVTSLFIVALVGTVAIGLEIVVFAGCVLAAACTVDLRRIESLGVNFVSTWFELMSIRFLFLHNLGEMSALSSKWIVLFSSSTIFSFDELQLITADELELDDEVEDEEDFMCWAAAAAAAFCCCCWDISCAL
jgi:hypothetical protein